MKKKQITGIIIAALVIVAVGGYYGYAAVNKDESAKAVSKIETTKLNTSKTDEKTSEVDTVKNPNALSPTIKALDETDCDTHQWWSATQEQLLAKLSGEAKKYNDKQIQSIVDNANIIPLYLIRLAVMHPESIPYVAGYPTRKLNQPINIDSYYTKGKIPLFQQWDKQWGYDTYGNGPIAMDGCGPTSVAMVVVGLTGNLNVNPRVIAEYGEKHGGYVYNQGSSSVLMTSVAEHFGVKETEISEGQVKDSLRAGHPVIVSLGPGEFTLTGHLIVLSGITKDGRIIMNNPDSVKDSETTWSLQDIANSAMVYYSYQKA